MIAAVAGMLFSCVNANTVHQEASSASLATNLLCAVMERVNASHGADMDALGSQSPVLLTSPGVSTTFGEMEDPFWVPPELIAFARNKIAMVSEERSKAEALLRFLVWPEELGGLGLHYSNDRTRTINEVWLERKANCLSLTLVYVMLAKHLRINATFAESLEAINWSRVGNVVRAEKHMVAVIQRHSGGDLVADFLSQTRSRYGNYFVNIVTDAHAKSMYYSNIAVEALIVNDIDTAAERISVALEHDPASSQAWNVKGVIEKHRGNTADAIRSYITSIRYNPNNAAAVSNLAALYKAEGFLEESVRLRALEGSLRKKDPYYFAFLASEAMEKNDLVKAQKSLQRAIKIHPKDADFYVTLSHVYQLQGKSNEAVDTLIKARKHAVPEKVADLDVLIQTYRIKPSALTAVSH